MKREFKTIIPLNKSLEYEYICIPPDKQIPMHSQKTWELSCVITGEGTRLLSEVSEPFKAGETVLVPPGVPHCWHFNKDKTDADGNIANVTMFFSSDFLNNLASCFPEFNESITHLTKLGNATIFTGEVLSRVYNLMLRMRDETTEKRILSFLEILLIIAEDKTGRMIVNSRVRSRSERRMAQIKSYVNCNYSRDISINEVVAHVGMNKSSFCSFIKRETGMTFTGYLNNLRLSLAAELLKDSDISVAEAGSKVGLQDSPYFCRLFKKKYGVTPTKYRNKQ